MADAAEARRLAQYSEGSIQRAIELADPELWSFRNTLFQGLAQPTLDSLRLAQGVASFVDEAGKEASARRARLRQVVAFAADFYRQLLARPVRHGPVGRSESCKPTWPGRFKARANDSEATARRLERCLDAAAQIDRNANQSTLIECWMDDLAAGASGAGVGIRD